MDRQRVARELVKLAKRLVSADYTIDKKKVRIHPSLVMEVSTYSDDGSFFFTILNKKGEVVDAKNYRLKFSGSANIYADKDRRRVMSLLKKYLSKIRDWSAIDGGNYEEYEQVVDELGKALSRFKTN